jgi:tRNA1(Val) A37 N6-methylase TrmN6
MILEQWNKLKDLDAYTPLFARFKKYFGYLNTGYKGKQYNVYAYNGGLFKADAILDTITIDDDLLYKHTLKLSEYDFDSEVDVNILGHIFENSLNELDEIKAQLEGLEIDKSRTKRKKDGVFYTPKYITKYIVENTVGKLCEEKKAELEIVEDDYITDKKRQKKTIKGLVDKLTDYRNWLLQLTICDPACGSGAFLNQALDFLILEHKYIDELQAKLFGDAMVLSDVEKTILENNLFGVDINEESVEIAKLSLWLRTAQPNRKLNDLSNNIKCGNSLIDDIEIAGDKAFNWQQEFPQIFAKGGFDVVIGNPPYGDYFNQKEKKYLLKRYAKSFSGTFDIYVLFYEIALEVIKPIGRLGYITPNTFIDYSQFKKLRILLKENNIEQVIKLINVFEDAIVDTTIIVLKKEHSQNNFFNGISFKKKVENLDFSDIPSIASNNLTDDVFLLNNSNKFDLNEFLSRFNQNLGGSLKITQGITTGGNDAFINKKEFFLKKNIDKVLLKRVLKGKTINRYSINYDNDYILYSVKSLDEDNQNTISSLLNPYKEKLSKKRETKKGTLPWYCLHWSRDEKAFNQPKILIRQTAEHIIGVLDTENYYPIDTIHTLNLRIQSNDEILILKNLVCVLNSMLFKFLYQWKLNEEGTVYPQIKKVNIEWLPLIEENKLIESKLYLSLDKIIYLNTELQKVSQKLQRTLEREFELDSLPKKLQDWYLLSFAEFIKELVKRKVKLSLSQKAEWEDYFLQEDKKAFLLKTNIDTTDKEIDAMVYELYGLNEEEIEIVENS